jgi:hypothetical protein
MKGTVMTRASAGRVASALIAGGLAAATVLLTTATAAAAPAALGHPHIVANPNNLMVNTTTNLTGTGFLPNKTLKIRECSRTNWIVPQQPCATSNVVTVTTNSSGGFKTKMTAEVCPKVTNVAVRGFSETCYVGVPHPVGVDRVVLAGAAKLTVTGP